MTDTQERVPSERAATCECHGPAGTVAKLMEDAVKIAKHEHSEARPTQAGETPRDCAHGQLARSCRICELEAENAALQARLDEADAEIQRCHERLEITHCFRGLPPVKEEIPMAERASFPDAVYCRDATISLLERQLAEARAKERERCAKAAKTCHDFGPDTLDPQRAYFLGRSDAAAAIEALTDEGQG